MTAAANRQTDTVALTPGSDYADPGYLPDGKKRYPLDTPAHVKAAASYFPRFKGKYKPAEQQAIQQAISKAEQALGTVGA